MSSRCQALKRQNVTFHEPELKRISNRSSISLRRMMDGAGAEPEVDRTKQCPMLLRCFWKLDGHTEAVEYAQASKGSLPAQEIQIHTWPDCTLRELADLIQDANPVARDGRIRLSFALVSPTREGRFTMREIGSLSGRQGGADVDGRRTLRSLQFETGDFLDVAIHRAPKSVNTRGP